MDELAVPNERRRRHAAWLASWGLSDHDWKRIRLLADALTPTCGPPALDDLSAPVRVGVVLAEDRRHLGGELLGVIDAKHGRVAVLAWRMVERERERWAKLRRRRT